MKQDYPIKNQNITKGTATINKSGHLVLSKNIIKNLVDNFVVHNIGFFTKDKKFILRIYKKDDYRKLPYVDKIINSNPFIKKDSDLIRILSHTSQSFDIVNST
jgi:hypothetical protein